jgi:hypothetical protein
MAHVGNGVHVVGMGTMNPIPIAVEAHPYMFMGISIEDPEIAKLVKVIVRITACIILLAITNFVIDLVMGRFYNVLGLIVSFSIAACGYYGAKRNDKQLLCCFCGWNLTFAIMSALSVVVAIFNLMFLAQFFDCRPMSDISAKAMSVFDPRSEYPVTMCLCCQSEVAMSDASGSNASLVLLIDHKATGECQQLDLGRATECDKEEVRTTIHVFVVLMVVSIVLQCCAFQKGKTLHNKEYFDRSAQTIQEPVMAEAVISQPVVAAEVCIA